VDVDVDGEGDGDGGEKRERLHVVLGQIAGVVLPLIELFVLRARRRRR
jgi:hypothetical protein